MDKPLLYSSRVKQFILEKVESMRPGWKCRRVSKLAIEKIEARVRALIIESVRHHPTRGVTFKDV
jgi:hypothetical protein